MSIPKPATREAAADQALYRLEGICLGVTKHGIAAEAGERMHAHTRDLLVACGSAPAMVARIESLHQLIDSFASAATNPLRPSNWAFAIRHTMLLECHALRELIQSGEIPCDGEGWH